MFEDLKISYKRARFRVVPRKPEKIREKVTFGFKDGRSGKIQKVPEVNGKFARFEIAARKQAVEEKQQET